MSTQSVKNTVSTQLDSLIIRAKQKIKDEGKKKLIELKKEIPTPQQLAEKLKVSINEDSCSADGADKFLKKFQQIDTQLKTLENIAKSGLDTLTKIEEKLNGVIDGAEDGPVGKINEITDTLNPVVQVFQQIIALSPLLFLANSGPSSSGAVQDQITEKRNLAKSKVGEYVALFATIPLMINHFMNQARNTIAPLSLLKNKIQFIFNEVVKLRLFIAALMLKYNQNCDDFLANIPPDPNPGGTEPPPPGPTELEEYIKFLEDQYDQVATQLAQTGNITALERIYKLKDNLEEDYNISFKTINF